MIVDNAAIDTPRYDSVGIFRLQLFKLSETFIPAQVGHYHRYRPFYIGRKVFGKAPEGADIVLPQSGMLPALRMVCLRDPSYFAAALGDRRPALLHAHFAIDATFALPLARRLDVPLVVTLHGFDVTRDSASLLRSGRPSWVNFVLWQHQLKREATLFVCVSEFIREQALARGYPAERTVTVPVGIDLQKFQPAADLEPKLIVQVARLVEKKGVLYLIRAVARIVARDRSVTLVIIGDRS